MSEIRNDNPTRPDDDTEGHALIFHNDNETVERDDDTEGHRLVANNDNETVERDDDTEGLSS